MRSKAVAAKALFYLLPFITPLITSANVNIRAGEYRWSYTIHHPSLDVRITYSSRSTYSGLFGAGWCSGLDYEDTEVGLFHCGRRIRKPPDDLKTRLQLRAEYSKISKPIRNLNGHVFRYKEDHLVEIRSPQQNWKFKYNDYQNLVSIRSKSQGEILITYDNDNDRVLHIKSRDCSEKLDYKQSARKRWVSYQMFCSGRLKSTQSYEVTYSRSQTGSVYIQKVLFRTLKRETTIEYSEAGEILNINLTNRREKS